MSWLGTALTNMSGQRCARRLVKWIELAADRRLVSRSAFWDQKWYLKESPTIADGDALTHFLLHGGPAGRAPGLGFDSQWYISTYRDVAETGTNPLVHYLRFGAKEGRQIKAIGPPSAVLVSEEYEVIRNSQLFDAKWYLEAYPDLADVDLVAHYLDHGAWEGRAASASFDTQWYRARYPDVDASGLNPIIFHIRHGQDRDTTFPSRLREMLKLNIFRWSAIEAEIRTERRFHSLERLPINASIPSVPLFQAWTRLFGSLPAGVDRIVFVPWLTHGGADLAAANIVKAAIEVHGVQSVLVVVTDAPRLEAINWLPQGALVVVIPLINSNLGHDDRVRLIELIVFSLRPKSVMNVNSHACWDLFLTKGKALSRFSQLFATMFCQDYTDSGVPIGYSDTHFVGTIANITKIYVDNITFVQRLISDFQLPVRYASKLVHLPQPCVAVIEAVRPVENRQRMRVIWAGRFAKQKNMRLLERIIRYASDIDFVVYGAGDDGAEASLTALSEEVGNLSLRGGYKSLEELPFREFDAFLFTSLWEGLPTTIIHVGAIELPIVASGVGGIHELIDDKTGWRIDSIHDEALYAGALREIWTDKVGAARRARRLRQSVLTSHDWAGFVAKLSQESSFLSLSYGVN